MVRERSRVALVTGATGFIGSHLVEALLARGWRVRCLVRKTSVLRWLPTDDVSLINADIALGGEELERATRNVSVVFHLAGITSAADDSAYITVNVEGTRNVLTAAARAGARPPLAMRSNAGFFIMPATEARRLTISARSFGALVP